MLSLECLDGTGEGGRRSKAAAQSLIGPHPISAVLNLQQCLTDKHSNVRQPIHFPCGCLCLGNPTSFVGLTDNIWTSLFFWLVLRVT